MQALGLDVELLETVPAEEAKGADTAERKVGGLL